MIKIVAEPMKEQIRQALAEEIRHGSGGYVDRLPPVKQLAERFGTSVFTIQGALELLARDQLVVKVHGSGTYLTERFQAASLKESVALCLNPSGHLNAEFLSLLARQAQRAGLVPLIIDCGGSEVEAMRQLALSGTRFFLVHGTMHFNPGALGDPALRDKHVVAVLDWQLSPPGTLLHMALSDSRAGSEAQARHLAGRGVRRALYVFSGGHQAWMENQAIPDAEKSLTMPRDFHFLRACRELGIEIDTIESCQTSPLQLDLDAEAFRRLFSGPDFPRAIVGARDVDAVFALRLLERTFPEKTASVEVHGYGNTPWSQMNDPAISTVDLRLEEVAAQAFELIAQLRAAPTKTQLARLVEPTLVLR